MEISKTVSSFLLICVLFLPGIAGATDIRTASTTYGLAAGLAMPGTWFVGDFEYDVDANYSIGGFMDYKLGPKISGGLKIDAHGFSAYETSSTLLDIGVTLKALIYKPESRFTFRPGIGIGYGTLGKMDIYESSTYFMLKGSCEVIYTTSSGRNWLGELSLMGSPDGGNDDTEMYLGTGILLRGGIVF